MPSQRDLYRHSIPRKRSGLYVAPDMLSVAAWLNAAARCRKRGDMIGAGDCLRRAILTRQVRTLALEIWNGIRKAHGLRSVGMTATLPLDQIANAARKLSRKRRGLNPA